MIKPVGKHIRFYGNRNKIVRVRNEQAEWMITALANRLNLTWQEAFELLMNEIEARGAFTWEHLGEAVDKFRQQESVIRK